MKAILMSLAAAGTLAAAAPQAEARDYYRYSPRFAQRNHERHHDDLDHRGFHRELEHRDAHRYPMTRRQHGRLHDTLDHEAFHDELEHRGAHRNRAYAPRRGFGFNPYQGLGYRGRDFSFWFGF